MQAMWVQSLDWEDPLEKGMATHSSILARRIPWTRELGGLWSMESQSWTLKSKTQNIEISTLFLNFLIVQMKVN